MNVDEAEKKALEALAWLVGNQELLPVFLGSTGASEEDMRSRAGEADFLASVVDFLLMDDQWVIACAQACRFAPEDFLAIRASLPGGADPSWT